MGFQRNILLLTGVMLSTGTALAHAQRSHVAPPAPHVSHSPTTSPSLHPFGTSSTPRDLLRAYGIGPNVSFYSGGAPSVLQNGFLGSAGNYNSIVNFNMPLRSAPNTFFPSQTTGFSTAPLFPYSSASFPYGYGFIARDLTEETQRKPIQPTIEPTPPVPTIATIDVRVPLGAMIWFQGSKTGQLGEKRTFFSPPLEPGRSFTYAIRASWSEGAVKVEQTRQVRVHAGDHVEVDFEGKK